MKRKKKKIGFVIGKLSAGGAERVISNLSNVLIEKFDITIITHVNSEPFYLLDKRIKVIACQDYIDKPSSTLQSIKLNYNLIKRISQIIKEQDINIIIGFITSANILSIIAARLNRIPCIISERNNPNIAEIPKLWVVLSRLIYPLANNLVLQTEGVKKIYEKNFNPQKITVLPNPISIQLSQLRKQTLKKERIILTVGRLTKHKCQEQIITAYNNIRPKGWKVIIIGDGDQKQKLENLIKEYKLSKNIKIISQVKRIDQFYNNASIFVFTSRYEGFPNALIEAMHFGLPCVSTDCNFGPSDLIQEGENGFLVPIDNQTILESRIKKLINDENLRKEFSIKSKLKTESFKSEVVVNQWENLINKFV
ncbi:MAG: glycosyltransferase family 4 protein [Bacteroidia bacterium]|nr:glycosyltransferase family 4 protein [Bacteroidia bacterium]